MNNGEAKDVSKIVKRPGVRAHLRETLLERVQALRDGFGKLADDAAISLIRREVPLSDRAWKAASDRAMERFFISEHSDQYDDDLLAEVLYPTMAPHRRRDRIAKLRRSLKR